MLKCAGSRGATRVRWNGWFGDPVAGDRGAARLYVAHPHSTTASTTRQRTVPHAAQNHTPHHEQ